MTSVWKLSAAVGIALATAALVAPAAGAATAAPATAHQHGVVFVQDDAVGGNTVLAYDRSSDGALTAAGRYPTGGLGGALGGSVVDHLAAEGSLTYDSGAHLLLAVNAGSNTITTFSVRGDHLTRRQVLPSGGEFPVSITTHDHQVFVLNARAGGSISGYVELGGYLLPIPSWHRALGLDTSSPGSSNEFTSTPGQIGFTPDGTQLLVSTKNGGNSVESFAVRLFGPAARPVITALPGTVPFGFDFDASGHLVLTEAGPNAVATFRVGRSGTLTSLDSVATGQQATCWAVVDGHTIYASNAGSGTLSVDRSGASGALVGIATVSDHPGTVDAAVSADRRNLYVQSGAAGLVTAYRITDGGGLQSIGSVTVPDAVGAEGIVAL